MGGSIGELWLPGIWAPIADELIADPFRAKKKIFRGALELLASADEDWNLEHINETDFGEMRRYSRDVLRPAENHGKRLDNLFGRRREAEEEPSVWSLPRSLGGSLLSLRDQDVSFADPAVNARDRGQMLPLALEMIAQALRCADNILNIASTAERLRIPILWFDYGLFEEGKAAVGGIKGFLEPVNAVEVAYTPAHSEIAAKTFLNLLRLTPQNRESLVFLKAWEKDEPAVLFTADSRLSGRRTTPRASGFPKPSGLPPSPLKCALLITAPHHGSASNDDAYRVLSGWLTPEVAQDALYVRNHTLKAGQIFRTMPQHICVFCGAPSAKTVTASSGIWNWTFTRCC